MTPRWYGAVVALAALSATSACADRSQIAGTQSVASIAAPTALSRPSGGPLNVVATAPAPPPPTAPAPAATAPAPTATASVIAATPARVRTAGADRSPRPDRGGRPRPDRR